MDNAPSKFKYENPCIFNDIYKNTIYYWYIEIKNKERISRGTYPTLFIRKGKCYIKNLYQ